MKVQLISYSQIHAPTFVDYDVDEGAVDYSEKLKTPQDIVAYCARVSNPSNQLNTQTNEKLIKYLIKNAHWSPFECVSACLEIETTRDIARQILRHRSFSFQEFSQRYANPIMDLNFTLREARLQDDKNRQNSIETSNENLKKEWKIAQHKVQKYAEESYMWAVQNGIAKEVARSVLPEGLTESKIYMQGSFRSWIHYIQVRTEKGTQKEHREVALACAKAIEPIFPMIMDFVKK